MTERTCTTVGHHPGTDPHIAVGEMLWKVDMNDERFYFLCEYCWTKFAHRSNARAIRFDTKLPESLVTKIPDVLRRVRRSL